MPTLGDVNLFDDDGSSCESISQFERLVEETEEEELLFVHPKVDKMFSKI